MYQLKSHIVPPDSNLQRLERYCRGLFPELQSNKSVKKAIKSGAVLVNGNQSSTGYFVQINDEIQLWDLELNQPKPYTMDLDIVYEDEDMAVVFKPAGLVTSGNQFRTLVNVIQSHVKVQGEGALKYAQPVHRLDTATSGLVVVAKSIRARIRLGQMFTDKSIQKTYTALVAGDLKEVGQINQPIDGKEAITNLKVLNRLESLNNGFITKVQLSPLTGRTHQLRIHLSSLGHPIIGDAIYGIEGDTLLHKGLFLCATKLQMNHPVTNKPIVIEVPVPEKFDKLMEREFNRYKKYKDE